MAKTRKARMPRCLNVGRQRSFNVAGWDREPGTSGTRWVSVNGHLETPRETRELIAWLTNALPWMEEK